MNGFFSENRAAAGAQEHLKTAHRFIDTPGHDAIAELHAYWLRKCAGRPMPDRRDISPSEFPRLLPNIVIIEAVDGGMDFRTRLFGTALVDMLGEERTGKLFSTFAENSTIPTNPGFVRMRWFEITRSAFTGSKPVFAEMLFSASNRLYLKGHAIATPLTDGGTETAQILGALFATRAF